MLTRDVSGRQRFFVWLLAGSFLPLCWLLMMAVHECGHVCGAWLTGGRVATVVLHPLEISRTDLADNPHPLTVAWAGPVFGVAVPCLIWVVWRGARIPGAFLPRFFAGFCCVANGAYVGVGSFAKVGDAGTLLDHGSPPWVLWGFGAVMVPAGLWLWHRLGPEFGIGADGRRVRPVAAFTVLALFIVLAALAAILSR